MCLLFEFKHFKPRKTLKSCLCSKASLLYQVVLVRAPSAAHAFATVGFGRKVEVKAEGELSKSLKTRNQPLAMKKCCAGAYGLSPLKQCPTLGVFCQEDC